MKDLNAYGNITKTNLLVNEFIKGRQKNLTDEEEVIVNEVKDKIDMASGFSFLEKSRQVCRNLFTSIDFRGMKITWNDIDEGWTLGPSYYPTDFGSCCLIVPHLDLKPINDNSTVEERYQSLNADSINGEVNGLNIVLDAEQFNYAYHHSNAAGFKISMHNHLDKPMIQFSSQLIYTGTETQINLKPTFSYTTKDAISRFYPDDRSCYADGEVNLTYLTYYHGYRYEMNNCLVDQGIRDIIWNCRCIPSFGSYTNIDEYLPFIPICSGKMLHCANTRMKSLGMEWPISKENNIIMPEALESPDMIGDISKPDQVNCIPSCTVQDNNNQMSFAPYPQRGNFFYQRTFCEVASHIWKETCQNENRAYFMDKDQPLLCPVLKEFDEFFGHAGLKHNNVSKNTFITLKK